MWTLCKKLSINAGIRSSWGGLNLPRGVKTSPSAGLPGRPFSSVENKAPIRAFGGYRWSKISQQSTLSELVLCGGICKKSREGSEAVKSGSRMLVDVPEIVLKRLPGRKSDEGSGVLDALRELVKVSRPL